MLCARFLFSFPASFRGYFEIAGVFKDFPGFPGSYEVGKNLKNIFLTVSS